MIDSFPLPEGRATLPVRFAPAGIGAVVGTAPTAAFTNIGAGAGVAVGGAVGVGTGDGVDVGWLAGVAVGWTPGVAVGAAVGWPVGAAVGWPVGVDEGLPLGAGVFEMAGSELLPPPPPHADKKPAQITASTKPERAFTFTPLRAYQLERITCDEGTKNLLTTL